MLFWILLVVWLAGCLCIPHLLLLNKRSTATLAWLWAILLFPGIGAGFYLMIGTERVKRRRTRQRYHFRKKERLSSARDDTAKTSADQASDSDLNAEDRTLFDGLANITQLPLATATSMRLLRNASEFYGALKESIRTAEREIHIESFLWRQDEVGGEFLALLTQAARRGVNVRLLLDELGCLGLKESYFRPLIDAGGEFSWDHTLYLLHNRYSFNLRNHRKLQIIDGRTAYVGGMNFGREYLGRDPVLGSWGDLQIQVEGTVVELLQHIFVEDWFFATGREDPLRTVPFRKEEPTKNFVQVLRGGPDEDDYPMLRVNLALIAAAKNRLWVSTGYFVPGETIQLAFQVAAARGVDVRLLVSEKSQHPLSVKAGRSYYDALLRQGVRVFEYDEGIEHSKYVVLDNDWSVIGSANFDERSMRLNFELSLLTLHRGTNETLAEIFLRTLDRSSEIDQDKFSKRPLGERLIESALRPLSPVL